ncbi:Cysteine/Serine-Rich Nuclear Protein 3 [Manis pentadactyla]|nr:Cysteine/Serine-Rich Nuclear Protein 3 [Manis pentadactyla]
MAGDRQDSRSPETIFTGPCAYTAAMSGILKRKFQEIDSSSPYSSVQESDDDVFSCGSTDSVDGVIQSTSNHFTGKNKEISTA